MRWWYRAQQFWLALTARPGSAELAAARRVLTPAQFALFMRLQPGEQAHGLLVLQRLQAGGAAHPDLLAAGLLHDVGKCRVRLALWERVLIVLARAVAPGQVRAWGQVSLPGGGWRRSFVVAEQHPGWGAELAGAAGASPLLLRLIARHQERSHSGDALEDELLAQLQAVDDQT